MSEALEHVLRDLVANGSLTGASAAIVDRTGAAIVTVGHADLARRVPLRPDARFRLASLSKPIVTALALVLIEDGTLALEDPIARWLPELAAAGPVLVRHLLDSTCGWGFPGDFSLPGVDAMLEAVGDARNRHRMPEPEVWLAAIARTPLLFAPGERWLYDTSYDLLGVLLARVTDTPLPTLLQRRLLDPLGMHDTGFSATGPRVEEVRWEDGALRAGEQDDLTALPRFCSGAGGLIGTLEDLARFASMLLADGAPVLTPTSIDAMTTDQLTDEQRREAGPYLAGQSWGYGGAVDIAPTEPWQAPGRYGWIGVTGTSLHVRRDQGTALVVLTSRELHEPVDMKLLGTIWTAV